MKALIPLTFLLVQGLTALGQPVFLPGSITHLDGRQEPVFIAYQDFLGDSAYARGIWVQRSRREEETIHYTPAELQAFTLAGKRFFSLEVPLLDPYHRPVPSPPERLFLEQIVEGKYDFFRLVHSRKHISFYYRSEDGRLIPLIYRQQAAESLRISPASYRLPDLTIVPATAYGTTVQVEDRFYLLEDSMYVLLPEFQNQLYGIASAEGCDLNIQAQYRDLSFTTITRFAKDLQDCRRDLRARVIRGKPMLQTTLLLTGSPYPGPSRRWSGQRAYGGQLEFKFLRVSPNLSLGLNYTRYTNGGYRYLKYPVVDNTINARVDTMVLTVNGAGAGFHIGYHFLPHRYRLRPFVQAGLAFIGFNSRLIDTQELRRPIEEHLETYILGGSLGLDYYFWRFHQLRLSVGYNGGPACMLGYGWTFVR